MLNICTKCGRLVKRTRLPVSYYETILKIIFKSRIAVVNQKQSGLCHATHGMIMTLFCRADLNL
jgi:hypothetical protein